jgi:hypothetical protein
VDTLEEVIIHGPGQDRKSRHEIHHATQNGTQFKSYYFWNFPCDIFGPQVTKTEESKPLDRKGLLYLYQGCFVKSKLNITCKELSIRKI